MSLMQLCWDLIWSPRSKGIPYVVENGTFNQGLKLMLSLFGIMLGISFVENIAVFLLTPVSLAYVIGVLFGYILMWAFFKGFWLVLAYLYVKIFLTVSLRLNKLLQLFRMQWPLIFHWPY